MTEIAGGAAIDTGGETARVETFFLGASIPTGARSIVVSRTNNAVVMYASAATQTAGGNTEVTGFVLVVNNGIYAQQSVNDGSPGANSLRYAGGYSGGNNVLAAGANSTALNSIDFGSNTMTTVRETTAGQGARNVGFTYGISDDRAAVHLAVRETKTTLATGTDPAATTIAPGTAATDVDFFTLQTSGGTETITSVTVNLSTNSGVGRLTITDSSDVELGFTVVPVAGSNTITVTGMSATSTLATFKVRVTPLSHATMPAVPGAAYAITAPVSSWAGSNTLHAGNDTNPNALTIDNLSPGNVTVSSCTAGAGQVTLSWTNPGDGDFNSVIMLRRTAAVADTPVEGTTYAVGDLIGSSTVACVAAASPCIDSGLSAGTAYHYRLFARDSNGNYSATGVVPSGSPCTPASVVSSFNVVEAGANAVTGRIHTKIAGQDIAVDIVALDASNAIATEFTGDVAVELVDNSGGGACASLPLIKTLSNQTFTVGNSGRHPLSAGQFEANAYRNVKFRISHPTTSPTVTSCSADAFANRPAQFVTILIRDANRTTAGTTNTLNNTSNPGTGVVHNAGQPFRIDATAQNGAGTPVTTTLYTPDSGQPVAVLSQCGVAAVCPATPGTVTTTAAYSALNGVITNTTASYNDVGSFNLALEDQTFAAVDAGDGTSTAVRYIPSGAAVTVGRFVPDYFSLEAGSTITPRSDIGACSASTFTYMGERMTLGFTLKARDSANNVTPNYAGATLGALVLGSLASYGFGALDSIAPTPLTARLDLSLSGATGSWSAGSADVTVPLALNRAAAPDGPYTSLKVGMAPGDPDGVALQAAALNLDADNSGTPESTQLGAAQTVRFGRLRLINAYGSELLDVRLPVRAEYYAGTDFWTLNSSDDCTVVPRSSIALGNYLPPPAGTAVSATNMGVAPTDHRPASDIVLTGGSATIVLAKPNPVATGSLDVVLNLGTGIVSPNSCATGVFVGGTAASLGYLLGNWCGANYDRAPSARVKLGSPKAPFIYLRERY